MNRTGDSVVPGESVIISSRVDSSKTWKGTMGSIDMNNGTSDSDSSDMNMGMSSTGSDDQTSSTSYPFYVELDSSDGSYAWTACIYRARHGTG